MKTTQAKILMSAVPMNIFPLFSPLLPTNFISANPRERHENMYGACSMDLSVWFDPGCPRVDRLKSSKFTELLAYYQLGVKTKTQADNCTNFFLGTFFLVNFLKAV